MEVTIALVILACFTFAIALESFVHLGIDGNPPRVVDPARVPPPPTIDSARRTSHAGSGSPGPDRFS